MAKETSSTSDPFATLKEQVKCPVCLEVFTQPKVLTCNHAFCKNCIDRLLVDIEEGKHVVKCPTCREKTTLPQDDAARLPPAFHINTIVDVYLKLSPGLKLSEESKKLEATNNKNCLEHDRPLEMFCEDCNKLVCTKCFHADHRDHCCDYVTEVFAKHQRDVQIHLLTIKQQISASLNDIEYINTHEKKVLLNGDSVKNEIDLLAREITEAVQQSAKKLKENVDMLVEEKLRNLSKQRKEKEALLAQLESCKGYIEEKINNESKQEVVLEKEETLKRLSVISQELPVQDLVEPQEQAAVVEANIVLQYNRDIMKKCSKIGNVTVISNTAAARQFSRSLSKPLTKAYTRVGRAEKIDIELGVSPTDSDALSCHLVADKGGALIKCDMKRLEEMKHSILFTPTDQGLYHIKVQVRNVDIPCNPCTIQVLRSPGVTLQKIRTIESLKMPRGIAVAPNGTLMIAEYDNKMIAVVNQKGRCLRRIKHKRPNSICFTPDNHILVLSTSTPHVTRYRMDFTVACTSGQLKINYPQDIAVSSAGKVYVCSIDTHHIQVLNPDLTFADKFGMEGSGPGQFKRPWGIAIDSQDTIYVCDCANSRIQRLSRNGTFICEFKVPTWPRCIDIDRNDVLYITDDNEVSLYDSNGDCFGCVRSTESNEIAVDDQGYAYVCDSNSNIVVYGGGITSTELTS